MSYVASNPSPNALPVQPANVGWHGPDQIDSFAGLGGTFSWPESPFVFARITFIPNPFVPTPANFDPGQGGFYAITSFFTGALIETGQYHTGVSNFVLRARIRLEPAGLAPPRDFVVDGMFTNFAHIIQFMLVYGVTVPTPTFVPYRIS